ncbi:MULTISPECIES: CopG family transcriptional regulator [unclassified Caballeronia]|uniref:CopG family transcriptional regulator n=1 Tax=unclassified Caballeronia TaxID=2646786 RepID=UPI0028574E9F|nr:MULTISPECIES: CopG family transcriptional regulator [unclassified Caballeronia]MDR5752502.1 CopG family transcriptional regulator [Caballeronia sp. LZ024]MDR5845308.1 CopG family transcriptional regulator [Caballeronia sp. LZ031]
MRTTLDIDDDVMAVVRARAERDHVSSGRVLSTLARAALQPGATTPTVRNGLPVLANTRAAPPATLNLVNQLRDKTP